MDPFRDASDQALFKESAVLMECGGPRCRKRVILKIREPQLTMLGNDDTEEDRFY